MVSGVRQNWVSIPVLLIRGGVIIMGKLHPFSEPQSQHLKNEHSNDGVVSLSQNPEARRVFEFKKFWVLKSIVHILSLTKHSQEYGIGLESKHPSISTVKKMNTHTKWDKMTASCQFMKKLRSAFVAKLVMKRMR